MADNQKTNGVVKFGKIVLEIAIILFAVGLAWATLQNKVSNNAENLNKHDIRIAACEKARETVTADIREIKTVQKIKLEQISKDIQEIKDSVNGH